MTLLFLVRLFIIIVYFRRRFKHLDKSAATLLLMLREPVIVWPGWSISCSLYDSIEGLLLRTNLAVAEPDVLLMALNFILEGMIY